MAKLSDLNRPSSIDAPASKFTSPYIAPPTKREGDVSTITGVVEGVKLTGFEIVDNGSGEQALFTFTNEAGQTARKYQSEAKDISSKFGGMLMDSVYGLHLYFIGDTEKKMVDEKGVEKDFEGVIDLAKLLFEDEDLTKSKTGNIKMVLKDPSGQYPKYVVPNLFWYGAGIYLSKADKEGYTDKDGNFHPSVTVFTHTTPDDSDSTFSSDGGEKIAKDDSLF